MNGAEAKRGTHGLRKRCPRCKKLRKFWEPAKRGHGPGRGRKRVRKWEKVGDRWVCSFCIERAAKMFDLPTTCPTCNGNWFSCDHPVKAVRP